MKRCILGIYTYPWFSHKRYTPGNYIMLILGCITISLILSTKFPTVHIKHPLILRLFNSSVLSTDRTDEESMKELHCAHDTAAVPDVQTEFSQPSEYDVVSSNFSMFSILFILHRLMSSTCTITLQSMHLWIRLCLG